MCKGIGNSIDAVVFGTPDTEIEEVDTAMSCAGRIVCVEPMLQSGEVPAPVEIDVYESPIGMYSIVIEIRQVMWIRFDRLCNKRNQWNADRCLSQAISTQQPAGRSTGEDEHGRIHGENVTMSDVQGAHDEHRPMEAQQYRQWYGLLADIG